MTPVALWSGGHHAGQGRGRESGGSNNPGATGAPRWVCTGERGHKEDQRGQAHLVGRARSPGSMEQGEGRELGVPFLGGGGPTPAVPSVQKIL